MMNDERTDSEVAELFASANPIPNGTTTFGRNWPNTRATTVSADLAFPDVPSDVEDPAVDFGNRPPVPVVEPSREHWWLVTGVAATVALVVSLLVTATVQDAQPAPAPTGAAVVSAETVAEQFIGALNDRDLAAMGAVSTDGLNIDSAVTGRGRLPAEELPALLAWYDAFDWRWEDATCETTSLRGDVRCELSERNRLTDLTGVERPATVSFTMTDGKIESVTVNANLFDYLGAFSQFNNWVRANYPDDASRMWTRNAPVLSAESAALFDQHLTDYTDHVTAGTDD